jgi:hypothetical protein
MSSHGLSKLAGSIKYALVTVTLHVTFRVLRTACKYLNINKGLK